MSNYCQNYCALTPIETVTERSSARVNRPQRPREIFPLAEEHGWTRYCTWLSLWWKILFKYLRWLSPWLNQVLHMIIIAMKNIVQIAELVVTVVDPCSAHDYRCEEEIKIKWEWQLGQKGCKSECGIHPSIIGVVKVISFRNMILGPFDTGDNLTPRTIWHLGPFDTSDNLTP